MTNLFTNLDTTEKKLMQSVSNLQPQKVIFSTSNFKESDINELQAKNYDYDKENGVVSIGYTESEKEEIQNIIRILSYNPYASKISKFVNDPEQYEPSETLYIQSKIAEQNLEKGIQIIKSGLKSRYTEPIVADEYLSRLPFDKRQEMFDDINATYTPAIDDRIFLSIVQSTNPKDQSYYGTDVGRCAAAGIDLYEFHDVLEDSKNSEVKKQMLRDYPIDSTLTERVMTRLDESDTEEKKCLVEMGMAGSDEDLKIALLEANKNKDILIEADLIETAIEELFTNEKFQKSPLSEYYEKPISLDFDGLNTNELTQYK